MQYNLIMFRHPSLSTSSFYSAFKGWGHSSKGDSCGVHLWNQESSGETHVYESSSSWPGYISVSQEAKTSWAPSLHSERSYLAASRMLDLYPPLFAH